MEIRGQQNLYWAARINFGQERASATNHGVSPLVINSLSGQAGGQKCHCYTSSSCLRYLKGTIFHEQAGRPAQTVSLQTGDPGDVTSIPRPKKSYRWAGTTSCKESTFIWIDALNECAPGYWIKHFYSVNQTPKMS